MNYSLKRMHKALKGRRFTMPEGISREEFRVWMRSNAERQAKE